jgi:GT2 family glycosyltransferase
MRYPGVYSIIVTYGNRLDFLKQTIKASINAGVDKLIIIDNGLNETCRIELQSIQIFYKPRISVHHFETNLGSAFAYQTGLKLCCEDPNCQFIWLLDDDNCPDLDALTELVFFWDEHAINYKNQVFALSSYREDRAIYKAAVQNNNPKLMLGITNSFSGFHFKRIYEILKKKFLTSCISSSMEKEIEKNYGQIYVAPYGGLFFKKTLIQQIGFPDETFFVYADDYDYTSRISELGGEIILVLKSKITDLEKSFDLENGLLTSRVISASSEFKCYYMFRNSIRFEARNIQSKPVYYINMTLYILYNTLLLLANPNTHSLNNYKSFIKGIYDGFDMF